MHNVTFMTLMFEDNRLISFMCFTDLNNFTTELLG